MSLLIDTGPFLDRVRRAIAAAHAKGLTPHSLLLGLIDAAPGIEVAKYERSGLFGPPTVLGLPISGSPAGSFLLTQDRGITDRLPL